MAESAVIGCSHSIKGQGEEHVLLSVNYPKWLMCYTQAQLKISPFFFASSGVYAFVVLKKDVNQQEADLTRELNNMVSEKIAKYACPDFVQVNSSDSKRQNYI